MHPFFLDFYLEPSFFQVNLANIYSFLSEDEQIPPLLAKEQPKSKWDDEDADEDDVKESWEDEDEPAPV